MALGQQPSTVTLLQDTHLSADEDPRLLQVGTWEQNLGSGSAPNPLPAVPGETLPRATSAKHLLGQERLITPGRGLLRLRKRVLKRAVKLWVRKASGGCSVKSHLPA